MLDAGDMKMGKIDIAFPLAEDSVLDFLEQNLSQCLDSFVCFGHRWSLWVFPGQMCWAQSSQPLHARLPLRNP